MARTVQILQLDMPDLWRLSVVFFVGDGRTLQDYLCQKNTNTISCAESVITYLFLQPQLLKTVSFRSVTQMSCSFDMRSAADISRVVDKCTSSGTNR